MATDQSRTPSPEHPETETLMARQYGRDVQHIVFGLHGTANNPGHVRPLTEKVGTALSNTPNSGTTISIRPSTGASAPASSISPAGASRKAIVSPSTSTMC